MATLMVEVECGEKTCDGCSLRDVDGDWCNAFGAHLLWAGTGAGNVLMRYDACLAAEVAEPEPLRCGAECQREADDGTVG